MKKERKNFMKKVKTLLVSAAAATLAVPSTAFATQAQIDQVTKPIDNLYSLLLALIIAIGGIVTLWGVFELGMAFWHQDSTGKIQAIPKIAGGGIMVVAGVVVAIIKS